MKKAIITGIAGQDGAFLAEHLLSLGYKVIGADRRRSNGDYTSLDDLEIKKSIDLRYFDLLESTNIQQLIKAEQPDEIYNLAAQSFVKASFEQPELTSQIDAIGVLRILEALRNYSPNTKFYQASTSEMFGKVQEIPQSESTPFYPRSPYGVAKLYAHWMVVNYRESYNMYACSGILFNHESEYRGQEFVTQKIVHKAVAIIKGDKEPLELGNIDSKRDWGYAKDYVKGMHLMLQQENAEDFVLATNKTVSVREFVEIVFEKIGIIIEWEGEGIAEVGRNKKTGNILIKINPDFYRPAEVDLLIGDYSKAKAQLNWEPKTNISDLADIMINHALKLKK